MGNSEIRVRAVISAVQDFWCRHLPPIESIADV